MRRTQAGHRSRSGSAKTAAEAWIARPSSDRHRHAAMVAPSPASATPARFIYEVCDSALPGGGTPACASSRTRGQPFAPINNCASPAGLARDPARPPAGEFELAWWVGADRGDPGGYVESLAISARRPATLAPANDHTWVYDHEPIGRPTTALSRSGSSTSAMAPATTFLGTETSTS